MLWEGHPEKRTNMNVLEGEKTTVQGNGCPVPVGSRSEQAGSRPSISSDCNTEEVGNLAPSVDSATRSEVSRVIETVVNPFAKSSKLRKSPGTPIPLTPKSAGFSFQKPIVKPIEDPLKALGDTLSELHEFIKDKHNVHGVVKKMVLNMKGYYRDEMLKRNRLASDARPQPLDETKATQTSPNLNKTQTDAGSTGKRARELIDGSPVGQSAKKRSKRVEGKRKLKPLKTAGVLNGEAESIRQEAGAAKDIEWREVVNKKQRSPRKKPSRPDAILVERKDDTMSYADILRKIKCEPELQAHGSKVTRIRKTAKGELLLELDETGSKITSEFRSTLERMLQAEANIKALSKPDEVILEIKDLDEITSKDDISNALQQTFLADKPIHSSTVKSLRKAYSGTQTATIGLPSEVAKRALDAGKIRIGWVVCRIREKTVPSRCFRCLEYGHIASNCKSDMDRSKLCLKCGGEGHLIRACKNEAECFLCSTEENRKHMAGTRQCPAFRRTVKRFLRNR